MKTYALVDSMNNDILKSLINNGVKDKEHIYSVNNINYIIDKLEPNDKVIVPTIQIFHSIPNMVSVFNVLKIKGISFKSLNEQRLNFSANQPLKAKYINIIMATLNNEQRVLGRLEYVYVKAVNTQEMITWINHLTIRNLSQVFGNDGILQKG